MKKYTFIVEITSPELPQILFAINVAAASYAQAHDEVILWLSKNYAEKESFVQLANGFVDLGKS